MREPANGRRRGWSRGWYKNKNIRAEAISS